MTLDISGSGAELAGRRQLVAVRVARGAATGLPDSFPEFTKETTERSIPDRFEQIVTRYAERIAVKTKSHTFTYDALNRAANRVAAALLALHGKRGQPVELCFDHDAPMIAAVLGVLKAGDL